MVAMSNSNDYVVEVISSVQPPPLLPSSQLYDACSFSYKSIEHMILYLSVIAFIIHPSIFFPSNFLQIDVLYHGSPVKQSGFCMSISYFNYLWFTIIHNIPKWCNIVFNTKFVIISWWVISKISTSLFLFHNYYI